LENMFVKFNKEYNIDLNKNDLMKWFFYKELCND
jgi:hypothetical protein